MVACDRRALLVVWPSAILASSLCASPNACWCSTFNLQHYNYTSLTQGFRHNGAMPTSLYVHVAIELTYCFIRPCFCIGMDTRRCDCLISSVVCLSLPLTVLSPCLWWHACPLLVKSKLGSFRQMQIALSRLTYSFVQLKHRTHAGAYNHECTAAGC